MPGSIKDITMNILGNQFLSLPGIISHTALQATHLPTSIRKKTTTAFVFLSYNGVNINAQSKTYSIPFYGIGVQKQIKDHNFGVFWLLPFSTDIRFSRTETSTPVL